MTTSSNPQLVLKPTFDQGLVVVQSLLFSVLGVPVVTVLLGTVLYILLSSIGIMRFIPAGYLFGLIFVLSILILPALFYEQKKKAYDRTFFKFYDRYLEYQYFQFFTSLRRGRIKYIDIEDVFQKSSTLQEQRRLLTISILVPIMRYQTKGYPGIHLYDLPQAQDYAGHIVSLVENGRRLPPETPPQATSEAVEERVSEREPPKSPVTGNVPPPAPAKPVVTDE